MGESPTGGTIKQRKAQANAGAEERAKKQQDNRAAGRPNQPREREREDEWRIALLHPEGRKTEKGEREERALENED